MCRCDANAVSTAQRGLDPELMQQPQARQMSAASSMVQHDLLPTHSNQRLGTMELMELPELLDISSLQSNLAQQRLQAASCCANRYDANWENCVHRPCRVDYVACANLGRTDFGYVAPVQPPQPAT